MAEAKPEYKLIIIIIMSTKSSPPSSSRSLPLSCIWATPVVIFLAVVTFLAAVVVEEAAVS